MTKKKDLEIRDLQVKDMYTVAKMLLKAVDQNKKEITQLIQSNSGKESKKELSEKEKEKLGIDLATMVLKNALEFAEEDLNAWFADLCGKDAEKFAEMPIDTPIIIFDKLTEDKDLHSFFTGVSRLYKKISK